MASKCFDKCKECSLFRNFYEICERISCTSSHKDKTKIFEILFNHINKCHASSQDELLNLWLKFLLPKLNDTVYNLSDKLLIRIFASLLNVSEQSLRDSLEKIGDISIVISSAFTNTDSIKPQKTNSYELLEIDKMLKQISAGDNYQKIYSIFSAFLSKATIDDLLMFLRILKRDLRIKAGPKVVISAINASAYNLFKCCPKLSIFVSKITSEKNTKLTEMCPITPMLAQPCSNFESAFESFPHILAEVKYDGERVQVHKAGDRYAFYSRTLKPVSPHKVLNFNEYIERSFKTDVIDLILDGEIVLFDDCTHKPLPFGTLGVHKMKKYDNASVYLILFDVLKFNGEYVMCKTLAERRKILEDNMISIDNSCCIMLSKSEQILSREHLSNFFKTTVDEKLEGIMLKNLDGNYDPGSRRWLKIKKDYLNMADTVDLAVLGAYFGCGRNGGKLSVFLMGCVDTDTQKWKTVCKVANCGDNKTIDNMQRKLREIMIPIKRNKSFLPKWLEIHKSIVPDFIIRDTKISPIWEVTGAAYSKSKVHTAEMISIRFPRITRYRHDKSWIDATTLQQLISISKL